MQNPPEEDNTPQSIPPLLSDPFSASFYKTKLLSLLETASQLYKSTTSNFNLNSIISDLISPSLEASYNLPPEDTETISSFLSELTSPSPISPEYLYSIQSRIDNYIFYKHLLETYIISQSKTYNELIPYNFTIFVQILNSFLHTFTIDDLDTESTLLLLIIAICETTYTHIDNAPVYLCSHINEHPFLMNKLVWHVLFDKKVYMLLDKEINALYDMQLKQQHLKKGLIVNITRMLNVEMLEESDIVSYYGSEDAFENYEFLDIENKERMEKAFKGIVHQTIKEFIEHMCSFGFSSESVFEFVVNKGGKVKLNGEGVNYYLLYATSSELSVKREAKGRKKGYKERMKVDNIRKGKVTAIVSKYPLDMKMMHEKEIVVGAVLKYLQRDEYVKYFMLNRNISCKLQLQHYLNLLSNVLINKKNYSNYTDIHIHIWKNILHSSKLTSNLNYSSILSDTNANINKDLLTLIESDVNSISFNENNEEYHKSIVNILTSITHINSNIKYYQGFHSIGAFLYLLTKNENEAFLLLHTLSTNSNIKSLFDNNNLDTIKCNVYIFERLLQLYLPSLSYYLSTRSITANYYIIPFMVTLFTNVLQHNEGEIPLIVMHIWNGFLIKGYKSLFKSLLTLLYIHLKDIYYINDNTLLTYLMNDLSKSPKFRNDNYEQWLQSESNFHINKRTFLNLKEEFLYENNLL